MVNDGTGSFFAENMRLPAELLAVEGGFGLATFCDVNGDGAVDLVMAPKLYLNNGSGIFEEAPQALPDTFPETAWGPVYSRVCVDVDGDGWQDLIVGHNRAVPGEETQMSLWHNNGDGTFSDITASSLPQTWAPGGLGTIVTGDFNADGWPDIAASGAGITCIAGLFLNEGDGTFTQSSPFGSNCGHFTTIDANGDGRMDLVITDQNQPPILLISTLN